MAASDEFKKQLKAGNIFDALTLALGEAIELEITTWVSSADDPNILAVDAEKPAPGHRMRTRINLVDGDIDNEIGAEFIGDGPYTELREFHLQQVKDGRVIIQQNLENLQQMFVILASTLSRLPKTSRPPVLSPSDEDKLR
ncbi:MULTISPECIES: hypothetical protein [Spirulina sp. CCY15215]|uniref:hypothetical protein n=1 Tax=Spirulina sp. CCY15215 TaxID=2767591 RepID=UPI00194EB5C5|nr:hypothetical protein [Spirulina major]